MNLSRGKRGRRTRQHGARALTDSGTHLDVITRKKTRRRINHVYDQIISIPMRLAQVHWRTKRLFCEKRSSRGVNTAFNAQMTPDSAVGIANRRH
jgi:hypothetical protein